jgi:hypothetical protein
MFGPLDVVAPMLLSCVTVARGHVSDAWLQLKDPAMLDKYLKPLLAFSFLAGALAFGSPARADVVDCVPERVRSASDRMDTRCVGINRWFIAMRANTDAEHFNQMIALLNSAIVSGKTVKLYYNLSGGNGMLWAVELFK